jgi:peptide/nickel transport system substrate-binding protein
VIGTWEMPTQLNPFYTTSTDDRQASLPVLRGCASIASDGRFVPDLCASLPTEAGDIAVDGAAFSLNLHLRPGLLWSDGQPLTMRDLEYTWRWATDPAQSGCTCGSGSPWLLIDRIAVSPDGLTANVHFRRRFAAWLEWLTDPIMPEHYLRAFSVAEAAARGYPADSSVLAAPFSGPFVVTAISAHGLEYARNPTWHGGLSVEHHGAAYLDALELRVYPDATTEADAFKAGEVDLALGYSTDSLPASALTTLAAGAGAVEETPLWIYEHFGINTDPGHSRGNGLWDPQVRRAIAMAVDRSSIAAVAIPGRPVLACSPAPAGLWYSKAESCPPFDPASARDLLDHAGWARGADGWVARDGRAMDLELCTTKRAGRERDLGALQQNLATVGVRSSVRAVDGPSAFFALWDGATAATACNLAHGNYDIAEFAWIVNSDPSADWQGSYSSTQWPDLTHVKGNDTRFSDPGADAALDRLATDVSLSAQLEDTGVVQDAVVNGVVEVPLYRWEQFTGVGVHAGNWPGYSPSPLGPTWDVEDWFYKP